MTQDQQIALSHWSMFGSTGFPVRKMGSKWWIVVDPTSLWRVVTAGGPSGFKTKTAAIEYFNNLVLTRSREWRGIASA